MNPASPLWKRLFVPAAEEAEIEADRAAERFAMIRELVTRHGFHVEVMEWITKALEGARVIPGPHEDMLYRTGFRDGLQHALDHFQALQNSAKET